MIQIDLGEKMKINKKNLNPILTIIFIFLLIFISFGCTEHDDSIEKFVNTEFLGIWTGNMKYSPNMNFSNFSIPENLNLSNRTDMQNFSSANITQLEFNEDTVELTIKTENKTITMSNSYLVDGNQLILSRKLTGQRPGGMQPPESGERPSDWKRPSGGSFPFGEERPSGTTSYIYNFNEDKTILYLDENPFIKYIPNF